MLLPGVIMDIRRTKDPSHSLFHFPTVLKKLRVRVRKIPRKIFHVTKHSRLCEIQSFSCVRNNHCISGERSKRFPPPDTIIVDLIPIFTFICGCYAFKIGRKLPCGACYSGLKTLREHLFDMNCRIPADGEFALMRKLDRGRLHYPSGFGALIGRYVYHVYLVMVSDLHQNEFLTWETIQQRVIVNLSMKSLEEPLESRDGELLRNSVVSLLR